MKLRVVCIIQARLTSTRLPGKIKELIEGRMILEHLVNRVRAAESVDQIVIAAPHDLECHLNEPIFIGSEFDVLDRYYQCAKQYEADIVVRVTADCPLVPPFEIDRVVHHLIDSGADYVTNRPGMPDGFDVEAMTFRALDNSWAYADSPSDREHVTSYIQHSSDFNKVSLESPKLSVDTSNDLEQVRRWYGLEMVGQGCACDRRDRFLRDKLHQVSPGEQEAQSNSDLQSG